MRSGFVGFWPLHLVTLSFSSLYILSFSFSFHVFLSSRLGTSSLVYTRTRTLSPGLTYPYVAQVFARRLGSSVVPGHLVSSHCNRVHTVCRVLLSRPHLCVCSARTHFTLVPLDSIYGSRGAGCSCKCQPNEEACVEN